MVYQRINLSEEDKHILQEIFTELEKINIPTTFQNTGGQGHQIRTGSIDQKGARQTVFGYSNWRRTKNVSKSSENILISYLFLKNL